MRRVTTLAVSCVLVVVAGPDWPRPHLYPVPAAHTSHSTWRRWCAQRPRTVHTACTLVGRHANSQQRRVPPRWRLSLFFSPSSLRRALRSASARLTRRSTAAVCCTRLGRSYWRSMWRWSSPGGPSYWVQWSTCGRRALDAQATGGSGQPAGVGLLTRKLLGAVVNLRVSGSWRASYWGLAQKPTAHLYEPWHAVHMPIVPFVVCRDHCIVGMFH